MVALAAVYTAAELIAVFRDVIGCVRTEHGLGKDQVGYFLQGSGCALLPLLLHENRRRP